MKGREQDRSCAVQASFAHSGEGNLSFITDSESGPKLSLLSVACRLGSKEGHGVKPWVK